MMEEIERSPVLAAPSFSNCIRLTTTTVIGEHDEEPQADGEDNLCKAYRPLALKIASKYMGKGVHFEDLESAAYLGLVRASEKFDRARGAFGPYAKHWIAGEITRLFKPTSDALRAERDEAPAADSQTDQSEPKLKLDLNELTEREETVLIGRSQGQTLGEIAAPLNISPERVRQIAKSAGKKAAATPGNVARACIRDLVKRKGYRKPPRKLLPFRAQTFPCHTYSRDEIDALVASRSDLGARP